MTLDTYIEHVIQWLMLRRERTRAEATRMAMDFGDYIESAHEREVGPLRCATLINSAA